MGTESISLRIASTATWSDLCRSPWPMVCAQAIAARSTTRRKSSDKSSADVEASWSGLVTVLVAIMTPRWQLTPRRLIVPVTEQVVGLHDLVNLARPLVDDRALAVPIEAAHRVLVRVAVGAVNLHGVARRALGGDRREPFGQSGLARIAPAMVLQPPRSQPQQPRRLVVGFHLRNQLLHQLM